MVSSGERAAVTNGAATAKQPAASPPPALVPPETMRPTIVGRRYVASTGHPFATEAAVRILAAGGNAIDAGVAAGVCLNVVQPEWTNFGGVAPIMLRAGGEVYSIAGLGWWPRETDAAWLRERFRGELPVGVLRTVVPAAPDAWLTALERFGTLPLSTVLAPAIELASEGFPVYPMLAASLGSMGETFKQWPSSVAIYWPEGRPPRVGEWLRQPDLARTLSRLVEAEQGAGTSDRAAGVRAARDRFYRGDIAEEIVRFVRAEGGWLSREDMAGFEAEIERPPSVRWRDWQVFACGPWTQGPSLLQALAIVGDDHLSALGRESADYVHLIAEAFNLAFADRETYYGDPRHVPVPLDGLLSPAYARERRASFDPHRAFGRLPDPGDPWRHSAQTRPALTSSAPGRVPDVASTSYLCVADADGNAFSATPSDVLYWTPIVPGLGIVASGRGVQSRLDPNHPSAIAPGRRPRLTPNPALALRDDGTALAFGTPGGDVQAQAMLQAFLNLAEFGLSGQAAVEAPRFASLSHPNSFYPHTYVPGLLRIESRYPEATIAELRERGHRVELWPDYHPEAGSVCLAGSLLRDGEPVRHEGATVLQAGADPRRAAYAAGW